MFWIFRYGIMEMSEQTLKRVSIFYIHLILKKVRTSCICEWREPPWRFLYESWMFRWSPMAAHTRSLLGFYSTFDRLEFCMDFTFDIELFIWNVCTHIVFIICIYFNRLSSVSILPCLREILPLVFWSWVCVSISACPCIVAGQLHSRRSPWLWGNPIYEFSVSLVSCYIPTTFARCY